MPVFVDLFAPDTLPEELRPTRMTSLPRADLATRHPLIARLKLQGGWLEIPTPGALGYLALKTQAKLVHRPNATKDCSDAYFYVSIVGARRTAESLAEDNIDGPKIAAELMQLFKTTSAPGVLDVVAHATLFDQTSKDLLAQAVVDLFDEVERTRAEIRKRKGL